MLLYMYGVYDTAAAPGGGGSQCWQNRRKVRVKAPKTEWGCKRVGGGGGGGGTGGPVEEGEWEYRGWGGCGEGGREGVRVREGGSVGVRWKWRRGGVVGGRGGSGPEKLISTLH